MQQQAHSSATQQRVVVNAGDREKYSHNHKQSDSVLCATTKATTAAAFATMEEIPRQQSTFDSRSPKKVKSDNGGYKDARSVNVPHVLTSMFSSEGERDNTSQHNCDHVRERYSQHPQHNRHKHYQPHRSSEGYYSPRPTSPPHSQSMTPPPHCAQTYPHYEQKLRHGGRTRTPPRPSSRRTHSSPYPPPQQHHPPPRQGSASAPTSPSSAFEVYHRESQSPPQRDNNYHERKEFELKRRGGGLSPRGGHPQQQQSREHQLSRPPPAPISYVCKSARKCYPSTDLGKRIRDEVRSLTEGTRLIPTARFVHHSQGRHHPPGARTIRLLDNKIEILESHFVLGSGNFSRITSVTIKEPNRREREHDHSPRRRRPRYYACKSIKEELLISNVARMGKRSRTKRTSETLHHQQSVEYCVLAASQLAYEAHILSCLDHPNIVKMRGVDAEGILGFEKRDHRGFFLLMDILSETLDQKIDRWRSETAMAAAGSHPQRNQGSDRDAFRLRRHKEKLGICLQLASALEYLHERRIVYRDLKPSNIGFAAEDGGNSLSSHRDASKPFQSASSQLQLFDFGMSRELTPGNPTLTGAIGTMRYMAPEVCLEQPPGYDCDCDIYSYAIVCWELWTQKIPYEDVGTPDLYREHVCQGGYRPIYRPEDEVDPFDRQPSQHIPEEPSSPPIKAVPGEVLLLLSQAWKPDPKARIRWPKTRNQWALLETLVDLQLEERALTESPAPLGPSHQRYDDRRERSTDPHHQHQHHPGPVPMRVSIPDSFHRHATRRGNEWQAAVRVQSYDDDNDSHFSLREEDLTTVLGFF